jgi:hypothetical protein
MAQYAIRLFCGVKVGARTFLTLVKYFLTASAYGRMI